MDIPDDVVRAQFVAISARAFPRPWVVHRMLMQRGSLWVIFSTLIHGRGGLPLSAEPGSRRIIVFCGLCTHTVSYATTHHITPPFWAFKTKVTCGVVGCRRKPIAEKCFGCGVQVLCPEHSGLECSKCSDEDAVRDPGDGSSMPRLQHMVICLIPAPGTTLYTSHYEVAATPQVIDPDTTPRPEDGPLAGHVHESDWLPWPRPQQHCLLVTPLGSLLVTVKGRFGGFGVGTEDNSDILMYRLDMAPPNPRPVDPSLLLVAGAIVRHTKVA